MDLSEMKAATECDLRMQSQQNVEIYLAALDSIDIATMDHSRVKGLIFEQLGIRPAKGEMKLRIPKSKLKRLHRCSLGMDK